MNKIIILAILLLISASCKRNNEFVDAFKALEADMQPRLIETADLNSEILEQIKDSAIARPEKFAIAYNQSIEFHEKTESLRFEIIQVKSAIEKTYENNGNYAEMDKSADSILFTQKGLSATGLQLKKALENFNISIEDQLFFYPKAEKMAQEHFNIEDIQNRKGEVVTYMEYNFKGFPKIAAITKLTFLQQNALNLENTFLKELLENPEQ